VVRGRRGKTVVRIVRMGRIRGIRGGICESGMEGGWRLEEGRIDEKLFSNKSAVQK
jgi:hypothetical protein